MLLHGPNLRGGDSDAFHEVACRAGQVGRIFSKEMLPLAMAHAGKLEKFGA
jgi:2,3-bisphosphoglycerate-independent phosphoglycerate mutase